MNSIKKYFLRHKIVKAIIHYPNRTSKTFYVIPNDDKKTLTIDGCRYSCDTENNDYFTLTEKHKFVTFTYKHNEPVPLNVLTGEYSYMTAELFNDAVNTTIVKDIIKVTGKKESMDLKTVVIIGLFAVGLVAGIGLYLVHKQNADILQQLEQLIPKPIEIIPETPTDIGGWN